MEQRITQELQKLGAMYTAPIAVSKISFSPELRLLCEMNRCGAYGAGWGCPPGCGTVEELARRVREYRRGVVYQSVGTLEDSFDYEGMMAAEHIFGEISDGIRLYLKGSVPEPEALVLGAGACRFCPECTYPAAPCRFPDRKNISLEACGIDVSILCEKCGLAYIHGAGTITNTGIVLFN